MLLNSHYYNVLVLSEREQEHYVWSFTSVVLWNRVVHRLKWSEHSVVNALLFACKHTTPAQLFRWFNHDKMEDE